MTVGGILVMPPHLVREAVSRALRERGQRALRVLIWARRHSDPEIKARAEALLYELGGERRGFAPGKELGPVRAFLFAERFLVAYACDCAKL